MKNVPEHNSRIVYLNEKCALLKRLQYCIVILSGLGVLVRAILCRHIYGIFMVLVWLYLDILNAVPVGLWSWGPDYSLPVRHTHSQALK